MVALNGIRGCLLAAALAAMLLPVALAQPEAAAGEEGDRPADLQGRLEQARTALSEARIEDAEQAAREVLAALEELPPPPEASAEPVRRADRRDVPQPDPAERRALRARALDLIAQCRYSLGDSDAARDRIDGLLRADPGYRASGDLVGPQYVELVESRRAELVSTLKLDCSPVDCGWVAVDGARRPVGEDGAVPLLAGERRVEAGRRNFEGREVDALELPAGETVTLEVELTPVARDVVLRTSPPAVQVFVDGELAGETVPASAPDSAEEETSVALTLPSLLPGPHELRLEAPCRRPVERTVEVVLDAMEPGPLELGTIDLAPARGTLEVVWERPSGNLSLDGAPIEPGRHEVCPGSHELALNLAQRTAWFETVEVADRQTRRVEPAPRPTLALRKADRELLDGALRERWNRVELTGDAAARLDEALTVWVDPDLGPPEAPEPLRSDAEDLAAVVRAAAPEADRFAAWVETREGFRSSHRLLLVDPARGRIEVVAWTGDGEQALTAARERLRSPPLELGPFAGFDAAERADGRVVVGAVHPKGPAQSAGIDPGAVLSAIDGEALDGIADLLRRRREWLPGQTVTLSVARGEGARPVELKVAGTLPVPRPGELAQRAVLGELAHAEVAMELGRGVERAAGTLFAGLALSALGEVQAAATALDRASLDDATDPSQDARGTSWKVLEEQLRTLAEGTYANEVEARRAELEAARFGGRDGPPLRWAADDER